MTTVLQPRQTTSPAPEFPRRSPDYLQFIGTYVNYVKVEIGSAGVFFWGEGAKLIMRPFGKPMYWQIRNSFAQSINRWESG